MPRTCEHRSALSSLFHASTAPSAVSARDVVAPAATATNRPGVGSGGDALVDDEIFAGASSSVAMD